jgi:hypothetical protein
MSDIRYTLSATASKGPFSQTFNAGNLTASMSSAGMISVTLDLGTNTVQMVTATMNVLGMAFLRSLATTTTHTVSFGRLEGTNLYETVQLRAGEAGMIRLAPGNYGAKAAVSGSRLLINVLEG